MKQPTTLKFLSGLIFGIVLLMAFAPFAPELGIVLASGAILLPFTPLPMGILGTGTAGAGGDGLTEAEQKFLNVVKSEVDRLIAEKTQGGVKAEDLQGLKDALAKASSKEDLDALKGQMNELGLKLKGFTEGGNAKKSYKEQITEALEGVKDALKGLEGGSGKVKLNLKVNTASIGDRVVFGFREAGITGPQRRRPTILNYINVMRGGQGSNPLSWVERNIVSGQAAPTAEGATKPTREIAWVENKVTSETIAVTTPISKKSVNKLPVIQSEIENDHDEDLLITLEDQILRGTGVSPQLNGLITVYATPYSSGNLAATMPSPDYMAVIRAAIAQIEQANFIPTVAFVNPEAMAFMDLAQTTTGEYKLPPFVTAQGMQIRGIEVVATNAILADEFVVMDATKVLFNFVEDVNMEIGWVNDQFIKNQMTIRTEMEGMVRVKEHHRTAIVTGEFSVAMADLQKV